MVNLDNPKKNYVNEVAYQIGIRCGLDFATSANRGLLRYFAVLCLSSGEQTTEEMIHGAWCAWWLEYHDDGRLNHENLVPYSQLSPEVYYGTYRSAISEVARRMRS